MDTVKIEFEGHCDRCRRKKALSYFVGKFLCEHCRPLQVREDELRKRIEFGGKWSDPFLAIELIESQCS